MRPIYTLELLILVLDSALGEFHFLIVHVDENSNSNQGNQTVKSDACVSNFKYRIKGHQPPSSLKVEVIEDGKITDELFENDPNKLKITPVLYSVPFSTMHLNSGANIHLTVVGDDSKVKLTYKTDNKSKECLSHVSTTTAQTMPVSFHLRPTTIGRTQQHSEPQKDHKNMLALLIIPVAFVLFLVLSMKYRKNILTMYRDKRANHDVKQVPTVIHETRPLAAQFSTVTPQHSVEYPPSRLLRSASSDNMNDDYAELRTSDSNYAVPDIHVSHASLCSFASFDDVSTDDGGYRQPRHYSMSAISQHYAHPRTNNNISARSMNTLPLYPVDAQDYMSMGGSFPSLSNNHYDRPSSSHSLSQNTPAARKQCVRDQEDYVSMFSQEENYSNIGRKPGESFRDKKYVRKYKHKKDGK